MKFTCEVIINKPREAVAALYYDPKYFAEWQDGFLRIEKKYDHQIIYFKQGGKEMQLKESILIDQTEFHKKARYEHVIMSNTLESKIESIDAQRCKVSTEIDYFEIKSFAFSMLSKIAPSLLKKPPQKWLKQFKQFAERKIV